jgi:heptosyltransferase III
LYFLVHSYTKILKKNKKILVIIQRSNGDVFLSLTLIKILYEYFKSPQIDLLINDDTLGIAETFPYLNQIFTFSYKNKQTNRWKQESKIISLLFRKYDLSINLTSSDRSVIYALFASKNSISAVERNIKKSWWKKFLLTYYYYFDSDKHILLNNLEPLNLLQIEHQSIQENLSCSLQAKNKIKEILENYDIKNFMIFHPSAQYDYKIYPKFLRDKLLFLLNKLDIPILITGSSNMIDMKIKKEIPLLKNIYNLVGETSIDEYLALSDLASSYIGMDTLNMHIAAMQNKTIFAIFGPTNLTMWSPWCNNLKKGASENTPVQEYGNITIFQADLPCVACGKAGCNDDKGRSDCLQAIKPETIFNSVRTWYGNEDF